MFIRHDNVRGVGVLLVRDRWGSVVVAIAVSLERKLAIVLVVTIMELLIPCIVVEYHALLSY